MALLDSRIRPLAIGFGLAGVVSLGLQAAVEIHPHFAQEALFGFHAWIGFAGALCAFLLAWCVGRVTQEPEEDDEA